MKRTNKVLKKKPSKKYWEEEDVARNLNQARDIRMEHGDLARIIKNRKNKIFPFSIWKPRTKF